MLVKFVVRRTREGSMTEEVLTSQQGAPVRKPAGVVQA